MQNPEKKIDGIKLGSDKLHDGIKEANTTVSADDKKVKAKQVNDHYDVKDLDENFSKCVSENKLSTDTEYANLKRALDEQMK